MRIAISLPRNRGNPGTLRLYSGELILMSCRCLGKADSVSAAQAGNPTRDPFRRYGDTPTGTYAATLDPVRLPNKDPDREKWLRSYGKWQTIRLEPLTGDALTAKNNGRGGILIHGGYPDKVGGLRPTNGCIRVDDQQQLTLIEFWGRSALKQIPLLISEETNAISTH